MELLTVLAMVVTAAATGVLALYTKHLRDETQQMRELQSTPHLVVYLDKNSLALFVAEIVVKNIGPGPAYNIQFKFDSAVQPPHIAKLRDISFFADGFRILTPGQEVRNVLGPKSDLEIVDSSIEVTYFAKDNLLSSSAISETFVVNPKQFEGSGYFVDKEREAILNISKAVESIDRHLGKMSRQMEDDDIEHILEPIANDPPIGNNTD